jgi:hypothetical protein
MQLHLKIIYDDASKLAVDVDQSTDKCRECKRREGYPFHFCSSLNSGSMTAIRGLRECVMRGLMRRSQEHRFSITT